jgi:hypothetical protein
MSRLLNVKTKKKTVEIIIPKIGGDGRVVMAADCKSVEFFSS